MLKLKNLLMRGFVLSALLVGLTGCGEPAHEFVGEYTINQRGPIFSEDNIGTLTIGDDYIQIEGRERDEFDVIGVHHEFQKRTLILGKDGVAEKWKIIDDNTLKAKLNGVNFEFVRKG